MNAVEVSAMRLSKLTRVSWVNQGSTIQILLRAKKWISDPYRPELHYMRGPGPKWHEKNMRKGSI